MSFRRLPIKRLGDVFLGKMLQSEAKTPTDVRVSYLRAAHIQPDGKLVEVDDKTMWFSASELEHHDLRRDDVVIVEGGAGYGRSAVIHEDRPGWGFQNSIVRVRPRTDVASGQFLDYALQSARGTGELEIASSTATIPHFTADKVASFEVPAPLLDEQRAIADYLDRETARIDTLIEEQQRLIDLLHERRRSITSDVFGWKVGCGERLKWCFREVDSRAGADLRSLPLMSVSIDWGVRRREDVTEDGSRAENLTGYKICRRGDVVINRMRAFQGALGLAPEDGLVSPDYAVLRLHSNVVAAWLAAAMKSDEFVNEMAARVKGIGSADLGAARTPRINIADLAEIRVNIPASDVQMTEIKDHNEQTSRIDRLIGESQRFVELCRERRAALVTAAVTGQVDVREAA